MNLNDLFEFYGIKGENEHDKTRELLIEIHRKQVVYKESLPVGDQTSEQKPNMKEIPCKKLILAHLVTKEVKDGKEIYKEGREFYFCVNRPPRMVRLDTLQICNVCLAVFKHGFNDHTKSLGSQVNQPVKVGEKPETDFSAPLKIKDPSNREFAKAGMTYCSDGGQWVFPRKCELCKTSTPSLWSQCQKQRQTPTL